MLDTTLASLRTPSLRRATTHPQAGEVERVVQLIGAEFCAALSEAVLRVGGSLHHNQPKATPPSSSSMVPYFDSERAAARVLLPLRRDLSAHYGSAARRRGRARPLGWCTRPTIKHTLGSSMAGRHRPERHQLWRKSVMRRLWCPRCGLRLLPGTTSQRVCLPASMEVQRAHGWVRVCLRCLDASSAAAVAELRREEEGKATRMKDEALGSWTEVLAASTVKARRRKRQRRSAKSASPCSTKNTLAPSIPTRTLLPKGPLKIPRQPRQPLRHTAPTAQPTADASSSRPPVMAAAGRGETAQQPAAPAEPVPPTSTSAKVAAAAVGALPPKGGLRRPPTAAGKTKAQGGAKTPAPAGKSRVMNIMSDLGF